MIAGALALPTRAGAQATPPVPPPTTTPPVPPPALEVDLPTKRTLVHEGQDGRLLLNGRWYFRPDDTLLAGDTERWYQQPDLTGWSPIKVPSSWNATDLTQNRPTVGWYRKEFRVPRLSRPARGDVQAWKVRFEGSNYRTTVWLNGRLLGRFTGLFGFELDLTGLRRGRNTLTAKVSTLRSRTDITHWRPAAFNGYGTGGWWNSGGLLREVYVRPIDTIDIETVQVLPRLRCLRCPATVELRTSLRNLGAKDRDVALTLNLSGPESRRIELKPETVLARGRRTLVHRFKIERPELWQPGDPALYGLSVSAATKKRKSKEPAVRRAVYRLRFGVKRLERRRGVLYLNGRRLQLRGASIHEDDLRTGAALTPGTRSTLVRRLKDLSATVTRSHYPLHPGFLEAFDRAGILYWVDAPVYQLPNVFFDRTGVRSASTRAVRLTVSQNVNHPSVMAWSLANEPAGNRSELGLMGAGLQTYIRDAAAAAREIDDTRLIAIDRQSRVEEPLYNPAYRHLDALGVNEYFGWYDSYRADLQRPPTTTDELAGYLDELHRANPNMALVITEFGAEGSISGPVEQPGTLEFQTRFTLDHLMVHASKRYIAGSIVWALRDFRVDPTWQGGAPAAYATPPWHNKSLIDQTGQRKPVYYSVRREFRGVRPLR
ncbi:MAG: hypothetical protein H0U84_06365 [Thermoleophilaceae bacterium]|nr:hypothetical protein [Thermoleophilaceae bacterium]